MFAWAMRWLQLRGLFPEPPPPRRGDTRMDDDGQGNRIVVIFDGEDWVPL